MYLWQLISLAAAGQALVQSCPSVSHSLIYITKTVTVPAGATLSGRVALSTTLSTTTRPSTKPSISSTTSRTASPSSTTSPSVSKPRSSSSSTTSPSSSSSSSTPTSSIPIVFSDAAYINTILRHHNIHRQNHSASAITWDTNLAEAARMIAGTCVYAHNTTVNAASLGTYGQNIGGGYASNQMGLFITGGLYNGEVNAYSYFGAEPPISTLDAWGHFSQLVWKGTTAVGCATADCTRAPRGLVNVGANVSPSFTVCNYGPAGNYIGMFAPNVGRSVGLSTVQASYGCESRANPNLNC